MLLWQGSIHLNNDLARTMSGSVVSKADLVDNVKVEKKNSLSAKRDSMSLIDASKFVRSNSLDGAKSFGIRIDSSSATPADVYSEVCMCVFKVHVSAHVLVCILKSSGVSCVFYFEKHAYFRCRR